MGAASTPERVRQEILRLCHAGLDSWTLRVEVFERLQRVIPYAAYWCGATDPETLLFTGAVMRGIEPAAIPSYVSNELGGADANTFTELAKRKSPVSTLYAATRRDPRRSPRFREILEPSGQGDELRASLRDGKTIWGAVCLHRELRDPEFSPAEIAYIGQIAPHLAAGMRVAALLGAADKDNVTLAPASESPGLLTLADDLSLIAMTPAAEWWLAEIGDWPRGGELPQGVYNVATKLQVIERQPESSPAMAPRARVRTRGGQWLALHAARLAGVASAGQIAVILEPARPEEVAALVLLAYALTEREAQVAQLVLKGYSTEGIADALTISELTVQQHLKAIFDKVGVRSRRDLVAQIYARHYWPRIAREIGLSPGAWSPEDTDH
ncbi:MAG TPA: helix-turn-helix transcriptional regulator [Ktedonobacterales bacterium]|nr:helix-turn-helix transcriptional regulator [Ktedonobacterales bacterium]